TLQRCERAKIDCELLARDGDCLQPGWLSREIAPPFTSDVRLDVRGQKQAQKDSEPTDNQDINSRGERTHERIVAVGNRLATRKPAHIRVSEARPFHHEDRRRTDRISAPISPRKWARITDRPYATYW